jgi:DNA (cytosine-5)-methyltransferase 1
MERIAEGIRRHCDDRLEPFADALEGMGRDAIRHLRNERVVSPEQAHTAAAMQDEPFLVPVNGATVESVPYVLGQHSNSVARDVDERPAPTVAKGGGLQLCDAQSFLLRQQDGGNPWSISERPLPTIPTKGAHAIATPALIRPKNGIQGDKYSNSVYPAASRPHHTVISDPRSMLTCPSLIRWSHGGATLSFDDPMPTIATERGGVFSLSKPVVKPFIDDCQGKAQATDKPLKTQPGSDRYALCVPEIWPYGLDIKYRMLQPDELKQAQGFSPDFEIVGTKRDKTKQIGNAVPVNLATALVKQALTAEDPSLASFGGGISKPEDSAIPDYDEVVGDD